MFGLSVIVLLLFIQFFYANLIHAFGPRFAEATCLPGDSREYCTTYCPRNSSGFVVCGVGITNREELAGLGIADTGLKGFPLATNIAEVNPPMESVYYASLSPLRMAVNLLYLAVIGIGYGYIFFTFGPGSRPESFNLRTLKKHLKTIGGVSILLSVIQLVAWGMGYLDLFMESGSSNFLIMPRATAIFLGVGLVNLLLVVAQSIQDINQRHLSFRVYGMFGLVVVVTLISIMTLTGF